MINVKTTEVEYRVFFSQSRLGMEELRTENRYIRTEARAVRGERYDFVPVNAVTVLAAQLPVDHVVPGCTLDPTSLAALSLPSLKISCETNYAWVAGDQARSPPLMYPQLLCQCVLIYFLTTGTKPRHTLHTSHP